MQCRKLLCVAALMFFVAMAAPAFASINYTAVNRVIPNGTSFPIDFNHDGSNDFSISSSFTFPYCGRAYTYVAQGSARVSPLHASSGVILASGYAAALAAGVTVGPSQSFNMANTLIEKVAECLGVKPQANWWNVSNHYLGVTFALGGQVHYGWIELSLTATSSKVTTSVIGFAYETTAGKAIVTGQTGTPSACALPSTDQTVHICTPAAGSTVGTQVTVSAKARWDNQTIRHMRIYVDNVDVFDAVSPAGGAISTTLTLGVGSHHLVVTAWDTLGQSIQSGETFTSQ